MLDQRPQATPRPVDAASQPDDGLIVPDLLMGPEQLAAALGRAMARKHWLDAYLLSAGLLQLVEDRSHPDPLQLRRGADYLRARGSRSTRAAGVAADVGAGVLQQVRHSMPGHRRLFAAREVLAALTSALADLVQCPGTAEPEHHDLRSLADRAHACAALVAGEVVRIPACFRSFDQHPDDVRWLTEAFLERFGRPAVPVTVVGVRTSGSYLAPLFGASLRAAGASRVDVITYRPQRPFHGWEREVLGRTARSGGSVVVTDDPPGSGSSLAATLAAIEDTGVPASRITLLLSLFGDRTELPPLLQGHRAVLQPWPELTVHQRLAAAVVGENLQRMLPDRWRVDGCQRVHEDVRGGGRGHVRARYAVELTDHGSGQRQRLQLVVEGAGLGYLGRHALGVGEAMRDRVPTIYGFSEGLLYRQWLGQSGGAEEAAADADVVARYVSERRRALPAAGDPTHRMRGRDPVWEVAAERMSRVFGPLGPLVRPCLLEPMTRRLLRTGHHSVVDGATEPSRWLPAAARPGDWVKVGFHQRSFSHLELACYDAVFDLAGAVGEPPSSEYARALKAAFERETGERVDGERWLLYRLTQLWRLARAGEADATTVDRRSADAVHDYLADALLRDLRPGEGPLCALDLDGVLETDRLGYPATGTAGALALRGLIAHGYRPVLATGRSLTDARDRATVFGLAGAVAEYGAVVYDQRSQRVVDLRSASERALVDRVRAQLTRSGLEVDPGHQYAVRVRASGGPLPPDVVQGVPLLHDPRLHVVQGQAQSDVTIRRITKATGLRALEELMAAPCVLAVGDSVADLPMLEMATLARAPRNADPRVERAGIRRTRGAYQKGLMDACGDLLGHRPGSCPVCAAPRHPLRTRQLLAWLALADAGSPGLPRRAMHLAALGALGALTVDREILRERRGTPAHGTGDAPQRKSSIVT